MGKFVSTYEKQYQDGNYAAQREVLKQTKSSSIVEPVVKKILFAKEEIQKVMDELSIEYKEFNDKRINDRRTERFFNDPSSLIFRMKKLEPEYSAEQIDRFLKILNGIKIYTIKDLRFCPQLSRWKNSDLQTISKSSGGNNEVLEFLGFMKKFIISLKFDK